MTPTISIQGEWEKIISGTQRTRLEQEVLPEYFPRQRWFAGKSRGIEWVQIEDSTPPGALPGLTFLVWARVCYHDGGHDLYLLPLAIVTGDAASRLRNEHSTAVLAVLRRDGEEAVLHDALADRASSQGLLSLIEHELSLTTEDASVRGMATRAFRVLRGPGRAVLPAQPRSLEQSNSAVQFGDRLLLKLFRRLERGVNPDFEIGRFLSERTDFRATPLVAGALEYRVPGRDPTTIGLLQGLVPNQGTAWEQALRELHVYYREAVEKPEPPEGPHGETWLELAAANPPPRIEEMLGFSLKSASLLGRRTAELHRALASDRKDPAFAPESIVADDLRQIADETQNQADRAIAALKESLDGLADPVREQAEILMDATETSLQQLGELPRIDIQAEKIRCHGDYHLGQVLWADHDFVILDFEGEPARPLADRRAKQPALRDVVGMLRSYDYAAYAGLFAEADGDAGLTERLLPWAQCWSQWVSAAFLKSYLHQSAGAGFVPEDPLAMLALLRVLLLDKAYYELLYELNNRPSWVPIPLQSLLSLVETAPAGVAASRTADRGARRP
ncbi:MAG TPA: putative maltokinase [Planctomycetaceae bacterium]|nr:putative maltokinase [Planctomycetaceae bacterium]